MSGQIGGGDESLGKLKTDRDRIKERVVSKEEERFKYLIEIRIYTNFIRFLQFVFLIYIIFKFYLVIRNLK